jgi:DNA polymerase elongation subunit (family B)
MKVAGYEYKASHAAPLSKQVQGTIFQAISTGAEEEEVVEALRPIVRAVLQGETPLADLSSWTRLGKKPEEYNPSHTPNGAKAALYYNKHLSDDKKFSMGDSVPWVYVSDPPEGLPPTNVVAYMNESELDEFLLDRTTMVEKLVKAKIESAFKEAMGWDTDRAVGKPAPKRYW